MARPTVGIGLLLIKGNKILLGKRIASHGTGEYNGCGGKLEALESFEDCIRRELAEECGPDLKIKNLRFLCVANLRKYAPKHFVDIGMVAEWKSGEPKVMEPEKQAFWGWYDIDNPPTPLFALNREYIEAYKTGRIYFTR